MRLCPINRIEMALQITILNMVIFASCSCKANNENNPTVNDKTKVMIKESSWLWKIALVFLSHDLIIVRLVKLMTV